VTLTIESPSAAMFSRRQIAVSTFLGSPLAAGWLFRQNYLALGDEGRATRALWLGLGATIAVLVIAFELPKGFPNELLPLGYIAAIDWYAWAQFRGRYDKYLADGGRKGSWWTVVCVSLVALLAVIAMLTAVVTVTPGLTQH
jgi:hypothetical protein